MVAECKPMSFRAKLKTNHLSPSHSPAKTPGGGFSESLRQRYSFKRHHVGGKLKTSSTKRKRSPLDQSADAGIAGGGGRNASKRSTHALEGGIFFF